jgi:hypothetical protein
MVTSMGSRNAYKDMLDNVVSPITCVSMNHQNQLEQMANGAMFTTIQSSLVRCCFLRNLLGLLGWGQILPGSGSFIMIPSKQALMRVT